MPQSSHDRLWLAAIVAVTVVLRLLFMLILDPNHPASGGDVQWYFTSGWQLIRNVAPPLQTGPVFLIYVGLLQLFAPPFNVLSLGAPLPALDIMRTIIPAIALDRLLNVGWHVLLVVSVYWLGQHYFNTGVARLAALVVAIGPAFIIEANLPLTESVYMGLLFGTLALYATRQDRATVRFMVLIGVLLGVATLTRAVLILFPVLLAAQVIRLHGWRRGLRLALALLIAYGVTESTWTIYNLLRWNRIVIGAEGVAAFTYMGFAGQQSPTAVDQALNVQANTDRNAVFGQQILNELRTALPDYIKRRFQQISEAVLQPHNTVYYPGESLKDEAQHWLTGDRSLNGLLALVRGDAFWPKLALYLFHYWALLFGLIGLLLNWRRFWNLLPIYGYVLYTLAVHSVLLAIPRYLFPIEPILILFGASATVAAWNALRTRQTTARALTAA